MNADCQVNLRSASFAAARKQNLQETAEDYTELIADLIHLKKEARTCEIARLMGVSHVTALKVIRRLQKEGYVETAPHQPILLTDKGWQLAEECKERHTILIEFLTQLGVAKERALLDVEGMEHHISRETLQAFSNHLQRKMK